MNRLRTHGSPPFEIAVIHGGPGAAGEMAPVAHELASRWGVVEPLQTADSVDGQVRELKSILEDFAHPPVTLIGFSWGAWLSYLLAAGYPALARKIVLVSSGPFEEKYAATILETRLKRLGRDERSEVQFLLDAQRISSTDDTNRSFARLGALLSKADSYDPLPSDFESVGYDAGLFRSVWAEAAELRRSGRLLELGRQIRCPVVAIHGDHDPHPSYGVRKPLARVVKDFRFVLLRSCGHRPWLERRARDHFYRVLTEEVDSPQA